MQDAMSTNLLHGCHHLGLHFVHCGGSAWRLGRFGCLWLLVLVVWGLLLLNMDWGGVTQITHAFSITLQYTQYTVPESKM